MRRHLPLLLGILAGAAALLMAGPAAAQAPEQSSLQWNGCGGGFECARLNVPLDYSKPSGDAVKLALLRLPASDQSGKLGSLIVNPGGPGGSAIDFLRLWAQVVSPDIRARFDLVTFDPRGVGESQGIVCHNTLQDLVAVTPDPQNDAQWQTAEDVSKAFVDECAQKYGDFLNYLGTKNVARDMESVRKALGEDKVTYLGYSYGTAIGQAYADMYPRNVRAMVLDGALDLSQDYTEINKQQMIGFERAYNAYLQNCRDQHCDLASRGDPKTVIGNLMKKVQAKPLAAPQADRPAGPGELETAIASALYSQQTWPILTSALIEALDGDGSALVQLTDQYLERNPDGSYPDLLEANMAVNYVDEQCPKDPNAYKQLAKEFEKVAPTFGSSAAVAGLTCAYWPAKPDPLSAPSAKGAPPIVVIDTTNDPATPYEWGLAVSKQISSAVLLTHRGNGHTIYAQGDSCVDGAVNAYLLNLTVPPKDKTCGNGPPPPGQQTPVASSTPGKSATATPKASNSSAAPTATAPAATAVSGNSGGSSSNLTAVIIVAVFIGVALLAAAAVALWQWRTSQGR
jgi:pimeloyl-ACP methyl ester carboxylesterase